MNTRPCGTCRHMDTRELQSGASFCWQRYIWVRGEKTIACDVSERADGQAPPGRIFYTGERG